MKRRSPLLVAVLCATVILFVYDRFNQPVNAGIVGKIKSAEGENSLILLSDSYRIDRLFMSMKGPYSAHSELALVENEAPELLWITGVGTEVVDRSGRKRMSEEFFCHANLSLDAKFTTPKAHNELLNTSMDWRLFTLVPGKMSIHLPKGYGIPITSNEKLDFVSMSLNLNEPEPDFQMRFKSQIHYIKESEALAPIKPLFMRSLYVVVPIANGTNTGAELPEAVCAVPGSTNFHTRLASQGMSCTPPSMTASEGGVRGTNTLHWMVPPGRHTYITDVTEQLGLRFDTTAHYGTGHLHPMGEGIKLRDKTTGETLMAIHSTDYTGKKGVARMEEFTFPEGIKFHRDHAYELETTYNNTTAEATDVMAIVYVYLLDKEFNKTGALALSKQMHARKSIAAVQNGM